MRITILYSENDGCDYHRLLLPTNYFDLEKNDSIKIVRHKDCYKDETIFDCDIVFLKRMMFEEWEVMNILRKKYGFKIVLDIDDYYILPYNHLYYTDWNRVKLGERLIEACKQADLVFVTNELLRDVYKVYNKNIFVIPNALSFDVENRKTDSDKLRFLYVSGSTHYNDLKSISGLFQRLGTDTDFKKKANFTLCGYNNPTNSKQNAWYSMESICKKSNSYIRRDTLTLDKYMEHYNYGDITVAPLEDTFFNSCKSNLKFLEASSTKKPFICSNVLPFTADKDHKGIVFCDKGQDWYKAFKFFINNPNAVEDYGEMNYEYGKRHYNIIETNKQRVEILRELIEHRSNG